MTEANLPAWPICKLQLKGSFRGNENDKVKQMMSDIGLVDKRNAVVKTLSGGMKRKLSVGIAFIGQSKVSPVISI